MSELDAIKDVLRRDALCRGPWALRILDELERFERITERMGVALAEGRGAPMTDQLAEIKAQYSPTGPAPDPHKAWLFGEVERLRVALAVRERGGNCSVCDGSGDEMVDSMLLYGIPGGYDVGGPCSACAGSGSAMAEREIAAARGALAAAEAENERLQEAYDTRIAETAAGLRMYRDAEINEIGALRGALTGLYNACALGVSYDVFYYDSDRVQAARAVAAGVLNQGATE